MPLSLRISPGQVSLWDGRRQVAEHQPGGLRRSTVEDDVGGEDLVDARRFWEEAVPAGAGLPLVVLSGCSTGLSVRNIRRGDSPAASEQGEQALASFARQLLDRGAAQVLGWMDREIVAHASLHAVSTARTGPCGPGTSRRKGFATTVMLDVNEVVAGRFELEVLSDGSDVEGFYQRLGWRTWLGPACVITATGRERTEHEDGYHPRAPNRPPPPTSTSPRPWPASPAPDDVW